MTKTLQLFGRAIEPGSCHAFRAPVGEMNDGSPIAMPVLAMRGTREGPTVVLSGAVHGDEFGGPIAIQQLFASLDPKELSGTLVGLPIMAPLAYFSRSRANDLDYEHFNLNRLWPGDADAFQTQRIAHLVFNEVVRKADYLLDYHEGGVAFLARYLLLGGSEATIRKVGEKQVQMARWFGMGIPFAYRQTSDALVRVGKLGNLTEAAGQLGIPGVSVELGGGGTYRRDFIDISIAGTRRVLQGAGLLPGGPPPPDPDQVMVRETTWLRPRRGGLLIPSDAAMLGSRIVAGTSLARIVDPLGEPVDDLVAPHDSVILDIRLVASVYPGDWTYHLAKL